MTNSRKQAIAEIATLEKTLIDHQTKMHECNVYLQNLTSYKGAVLIATLFPAFIVGWEVARMEKAKHKLKRLIKFGLLTTMATFRKIV